MLTRRCRRQGDGPAQARLPRDGWPRHVLGLVPCPRGHVVAKIPPETSWISRGCPELPSRYRCSHDGNKPVEEGGKSQIRGAADLLTLLRTWLRQHRPSSPSRLPPSPTLSPRRSPCHSSAICSLDSATHTPPSGRRRWSPSIGWRWCTPRRSVRRGRRSRSA